MVSHPIICFVHVPKTAGSTVNRVLSDHLPRGLDHAHDLLAAPVKLRAQIDRYDWLAAHLRFGLFRSAVHAATTRPRLFYTLIRQPHRQVMSHYNWLIEIAHRSEDFYESHPPVVKHISSTIRANDNSDPAAVARTLLKFSRLFLNAQSAYVVPGRKPPTTDEDLLQALKPYQRIATQNALPALLSQMIGVNFQAAPRVNESSYHFDPAVFDAPEVRNLLARHNAADERLYRIVAEAEAAGRPIGRRIAKAPASQLSRRT